MTVAGSLGASGPQTAAHQKTYSEQKPVFAQAKNFGHHDFLSIKKTIIIKTGINTLTNKPLIYGDKSPVVTNRTITFSNAVVMHWPWSNPEYQATARTKDSTWIPMETKPISVRFTVPYSVSANLAPHVEVGHTGAYLISISTSPAIQFAQPSYPTRTCSKPTPVFGVSTDPTWGVTVPWFPEQPKTSMKNFYVPSWTYRPPSSVTGFTVVPTVIPSCLISTFFGSLGFARTKGYVIPIDKNGTTGWHKRGVSIIGTKTSNGFAVPTPIRPHFMLAPEIIDKVVAPATPPERAFVRHNFTASTISNQPTLVHNSTFNDAIRIAATQAFSQVGVVLIAILIIATLAVVFLCCGSFLKWPMKLLHSWKYGSIGKLDNTIAPPKSGKLDKRGTMKIEDYATLNPYSRAQYLRGTAEAIGASGSFQEESHASTGDVEQEYWQEAASTPFRRGDSTTDEGMSTTAVVSSGSQSKSTGGILRRNKSS